MSDVLAADQAFAGHAGEAGSLLMPHELMSGMVVLILLILFLGALTAVMLKRLNRFERRLRDIEARLKSPAPPSSAD